MGARPSLGNAPECTREKESDPASSKLEGQQQAQGSHKGYLQGQTQALPDNQSAPSLPWNTNSHQAEKRKVLAAEDELATQTQPGTQMPSAQATGTQLVAKLCQGIQGDYSQPRAWDGPIIMRSAQLQERQHYFLK